MLFHCTKNGLDAFQPSNIIASLIPSFSKHARLSTKLPQACIFAHCFEVLVHFFLAPQECGRAELEENHAAPLDVFFKVALL
jgi:hypothetical protein